MKGTSANKTDACADWIAVRIQVKSLPEAQQLMDWKQPCFLCHQHALEKDKYFYLRCFTLEKPDTFPSRKEDENGGDWKLGHGYMTARDSQQIEEDSPEWARNGY